MPALPEMSLVGQLRTPERAETKSAYTPQADIGGRRLSRAIWLVAWEDAAKFGAYSRPRL